MKNLRFIFRMFKRNPLLVIVNIPGLAIGLSAVLLLAVYLKHELSFDQHFKTKNHVVRLYNSITKNGQTENYGICLRKAYTEIPQQIPEIKSATQIFRNWGVSTEYQEERYSNKQMLYVDSSFFDVFGLFLLQGNIKEALAGKNKVVLSASTAKQIFNNSDCIGKILLISEDPYVVSGVIDDFPNNTHFSFDILGSMQSLNPEKWGGLELFTYFRIFEQADIEAVGQKIANINEKIMQPWAKPFDAIVKSGVEMLTSLHLHTIVDSDLSAKGNMTQIFIVAAIALFILFIALINFINLYILYGEKRTAEIATRKSLGATHSVLSKQFFNETGIIGIFSFVLALFIVFLIQPFFAQIMQSHISYADILSPSGILLILSILVILVLVSGSYPSYYLSKLHLAHALNGKSNKLKRKSTLSRIVVVSQFSVSVFLINAFSIIYAQTKHLENMPLGFNPDNVIGITNLDPQINKSITSIQEELKKLVFIENVGTSTHSMGNGCSGQGIKKFGSENIYMGINEYRINPGFDETMQLELLSGRYFTNSEADKSGVILNEGAVKLLGNDIEVGSLVEMHGKPLTVIGIVKDFYYVDHPGEEIEPLVLTNYWYQPKNIYIRTRERMNNYQQAQVENIFKCYSPAFIYNQFYLTDVFANKFVGERRMLKLVSSGAVMATLISFIGLLALSILNVNRRTKEIGIRKVVGSSESKVVFILLTETIILVGIAILLAFAGSYFTMHYWLKGYLDSITLSPLYFLCSAAFALFIAFMATGWQSWRAATRNPVEALRYE